MSRPTVVRCLVCNRRIETKPKGPIPKFCGGACRQRHHRDQSATSDTQILHRIRDLHLDQATGQLLDGDGEFVMYWWDTAQDLITYLTQQS